MNRLATERRLQDQAKAQRMGVAPVGHYLRPAEVRGTWAPYAGPYHTHLTEPKPEHEREAERRAERARVIETSARRYEAAKRRDADRRERVRVCRPGKALRAHFEALGVWRGPGRV